MRTSQFSPVTWLGILYLTLPIGKLRTGRTIFEYTLYTQAIVDRVLYSRSFPVPRDVGLLIRVSCPARRCVMLRGLPFRYDERLRHDNVCCRAHCFKYARRVSLKLI